MIEHFLNLSRLNKRLLAVASDSVLLGVALWAAFVLRLEGQFPGLSQQYLVLFGLTVITTILCFIRFGLYRAIVRYLSDQALMTVCGGVLASALSLILFGYLLEVLVPRSVPVIYAGLAFLVVGGTRMGVRYLVQMPRNRDKEAVIIYGTGDRALQLALALQQGDLYRPVAYVSSGEHEHNTILHGLPVISEKKLPRTAEKHNVKRLLLALESDREKQVPSILERLEPLPLMVQTIPAVNELITGQASINEIRDLSVEDLLGRDSVHPDPALMGICIQGCSVMVTGAGGSIGSELCRQILRLKPKRLVLFERSEFSLYSIEREMSARAEELGLDTEIHPVLGSVVHRRRIEAVLRAFSVNTIYHAAAYKHVPLVEQNVIEGLRNNVFGTWHTAEAAIAAGVNDFVLISTDKAVRPTNVMGATKRMAELVLQGLAQRQDNTRVSMVRFGNVLDSSGSVVPLFRRQIEAGGPVTVTHKDIIRYFMTIPEASQLVLQASSMGGQGEVFVLDMGKAVKIDDLARKMIRLMGKRVKNEGDTREGGIAITYTGLRPGEKLFEELLIGDNPLPTSHPRILKAREKHLPWRDIERFLARLDTACHDFDCQAVLDLLMEAPTAFTPNGGLGDLVWRLGEEQVQHQAERTTGLSLQPPRPE
ncbi:MAG: nucleoside-diphosphate sugar epimerase/dehydratase [Oleiphilaceae bacterium]|nr:nucleoside-diphosphate sugar epimerase/dehydratase [Oleiphilaceae bacterium]